MVFSFSVPPKITPTVEPDSIGNIQVKAPSDPYGIECRFETADLSFTIFSPNTSDIVLPIKAGSYVVKVRKVNILSKYATHAFLC